MRRTPQLLAVWLVLGLAGVTLAACAEAGEKAAPGFTVRSLEGKSLRLADLRGKPVILDFWATWCGPCRASMPHLNEMQSRFSRQGLTVIGMSVDEDGAPPVKRYVERLGIRFPIALANEKMLDDYGPIRSIPTTFFINRQGDVVRRVVGYIDAETMESYVREIL